MFNNRKQLIYRFIKENDLYDNKFFINSMKQKGENGFSISFIDRLFSWGITNEGHTFWLKKQCEFVLFVLNNKSDELFDKITTKAYFKKLITEGYFSHSLDKKSKYFNDFKNEYIKIYGDDL